MKSFTYYHAIDVLTELGCNTEQLIRFSTNQQQIIDLATGLLYIR